MCPISAVVVDLPLVPVMATKRAWPSASRHRSSMSQMTSTPAAFAMHDRMRRRMRERHAGRKDEAFELLPGPVARIGRRAAERRGLFARLLPVVPDETSAAPPATAARTVARPLRASPKTPIALPSRWVSGTTSYLSFSVERPISASTTATIQKRITTCDSVQPSCSK